MKPETLHTSANPELEAQPGSHFNTASEMLLSPAGLDLPQLQGVLGSIMSHHVDYADLYFQYSRAESWGLEEGQVKIGRAHV